MVYYSLYVCQNYDRGFYDHSQDRFRAIPRYIIDKLAYYCLRFGPMATDGSHNSASIRKLERDKFCIFLLNYLNKTPHQLLRSKHKQLMGLVGCLLFIVQPSPISCFTNHFKFFGTSIKITICKCPNIPYLILLILICKLYLISKLMNGPLPNYESFGF
jgi:hypothetical protein